MEIGVNQQFYSWGAKKVRVHKYSKKAEILYFPSYQSSEGKSTPPLSNLWYAVH